MGQRQVSVPSRMKKGDFRMMGVWQASKAANPERKGGQRAGEGENQVEQYVAAVFKNTSKMLKAVVLGHRS